MRILMINKSLYMKGGAETYMLKLGAALEKMGHECEYFGMYDKNNTVGNAQSLYTKSMDFHKRSIKMLTYPFEIIYSPDARRKIGKLIEAFKPDIAHLNNINYQLTPSIIYELSKHSVPIVSTAHDVQWVCPNHMMTDIRTMKPCKKCLNGDFWQCAKNKCIHGSFLRSVLGTMESSLYRKKHTYRLVDTVIAPSKFMESQLLHNPDLKGKTRVIYNFIDDPGEVKVKKEDYVLFFGRFSPEKGVGTLLKAARNLPDIKFVFAGAGELADEIDKTQNAVNVGFKTGEELRDIIAKAAFSVLPSEWAENCPFSVMESQSLGTPVIGSDMGGIPELIKDGETGLIVKSRSESDLTEKIRYLHSDRQYREKLSKNCAHIHYDTTEEYAKKMTALYKELIKGGA